MDSEINPEEVNNANVEKRILSEGEIKVLEALSDELPQHDDGEQILELYRDWIHLNTLQKELWKYDEKFSPYDEKFFSPFDEKFSPYDEKFFSPFDEKFSPAEKALGLREFLSLTLQSVFHIPGHYHRALLVLTPSMIKYRAHVFTNELAVSKLGTQSLLSMGEAFTMFFPQITDIMTIMLCYVLMLWLVCPLPPVLQMFFLLMLIAIPCYYIPQLMLMASRIDVTCGFFNLPHIWFTILGGLVLSLIFLSLSLLVMYLIRRFIHPGGPTLIQSKLSLDALTDAADMV